MTFIFVPCLLTMQTMGGGPHDSFGQAGQVGAVPLPSCGDVPALGQVFLDQVRPLGRTLAGARASDA